MKKSLIILLTALIVCAGCATVKIVGLAFIDGVHDHYKEQFGEDISLYDAAVALRDDWRKVVASVTPEEATPGLPDGVDYALLNWTFGGHNGAGAVYDPNVQITNIKVSANGMTYSFVDPLGFVYWGEDSPGDCVALVCAFIWDGEKWVGGKFDWISTSRLSRDFNHLGTKDGTAKNKETGELWVDSGYGGWSLAGIPNPTQIVFVMLEWRGGWRRTNVSAPVWWQR